MSKSQIANVFLGALKSLLASAFKISVIALGFVLKTCGMILTKTSEAIDRLILKNS